MITGDGQVVEGRIGQIDDRDECSRIIPEHSKDVYVRWQIFEGCVHGIGWSGKLRQSMFTFPLIGS
jgi:hypothetical protein